jgi:hypothetical protein
MPRSAGPVILVAKRGYWAAWLEKWRTGRAVKVRKRRQGGDRPVRIRLTLFGEGPR